MREDPVQLAERLRQACLDAALQAYEDAGFDGLCCEGRWECAVNALRYLDVEAVVREVSAPLPAPERTD